MEYCFLRIYILHLGILLMINANAKQQITNLHFDDLFGNYSTNYYQILNMLKTRKLYVVSQ